MLYTCELTFDHIAQLWSVLFKKTNVLFEETIAKVGYFETMEETAEAIRLWCLAGKE